MKNVDVFVSDVLLKVNAQVIKFFVAVDFLYEVDHKNPKNKFQLLDDRLEVLVHKKVPGRSWSSLEILNQTKQELMQRRNESIDRYNKLENEIAEVAKSKKHQMEKRALDEQMALEKHQRKTIKHKKTAELEAAKDDLFQDLEEVNERDQRLLRKQAVETSKDRIRGDPDLERQRNDYKAAAGEDIFGDEDCTNQDEISVRKYKPDEPIGQCTVEEVVEEEEEPVIEDEELESAPKQPEVPLPEVREKKDVTVDFTEKKFPHLPARESHFKEAPYPKSKKITKEEKGNKMHIDIEDKDPLWLKDKGDHFYKRHDFLPAVHAYTKSIENDRAFLMSRLNRGTTFMRMFQFAPAVDEFTDILTMIKNLPQKELDEDTAYYQKMEARAYYKRGGANAWVAQYDAAVDDLNEAMKCKTVFSDVERGNMEADIAIIKKRKESQEVKLQGDIFFARNLLDDSLKSYHAALELDPMNEYALSNISVIYLKRQNYEKCLEYTIKALTIIEEFHADTREFNKDSFLEVKLLQRRAKCYEMDKEWEKAKADLDRAHMIDRENTSITIAQKKVQDQLNTLKFDEFKEVANKYL